eukprot:TRINITY_DN7315_c0_g1_i4.p1 TRINITY_DN7315_c0_g1~~TRINITY_DN7315_c0_g1_i4.p1  ORF type:complete len:101 (+),score=18.25 TRINITY_DN7315_c0_g1_i4:141-443(+)
MIRRPPRSTLSSSSAASDVYKRQVYKASHDAFAPGCWVAGIVNLSLSEWYIRYHMRVIVNEKKDSRAMQSQRGYSEVDMSPNRFTREIDVCELVDDRVGL